MSKSERICSILMIAIGVVAVISALYIFLFEQFNIMGFILVLLAEANFFVISALVKNFKEKE